MSLLDYEEQDRQYRALTASRNRPDDATRVPSVRSETVAHRSGFAAITTNAAAAPSLPPVQTVTLPFRYERTTPLPEVAWTPLPGTSVPDFMMPAGLPDYDYEVKSWPWFFEPMVEGKKKHDMRDKSERDYAIGDRVLLREFDPRGVGYTGRAAVATITYITSNDTPCAMSSNALAKDACILSVLVGSVYPADDRNA